MIYTKQQQGIIESQAQVIKIKAFAGTGKSSTLAAVASANPKLRMLYLAFNKSVQLEAVNKFPKNASVRTVSSIAYQSVGKNYAHKLINNISNYALINNFNLQAYAGIKKNNQAIYALRIAEAINRYINSDDDVIELSHINFLNTPTERSFSDYEALKLCNEVWGHMCDVNSTKIGMTHDGYLKLFRQAGGNFNHYDVVLLDEAQDSNPVTIAMFNEAATRKILVGDPHQAIYQFRGAVNAMDLISADENFILTQSFRFGDRVSMVANSILHIKGEEDVLVGHGREEPLVTSVDKSDKYAFIARSNATLFAQAVNSLRQNKSIHLLGGTDGYRLNLIRDAYYLKIREKSLIKNPFIKGFDNFDAMCEFSESSLDPEIKMLVRVIIDMGKSDVSEAIDKIIAAHTTNYNDASLVLSTAHKAKGLEFNQVILDSYFHVSRAVEQKDGKGNKLPDATIAASMDEINLAYVAATRAKSVLECPELQMQILKHKPAVETKMLNFMLRQIQREEDLLAAGNKKLAGNVSIGDSHVKMHPSHKTSDPSSAVLNAPKVIPTHDRKETVAEARKRMRRL